MASPGDIAELRVRGARRREWTGVRVTAGLTRAARDFELQLAPPPPLAPMPARIFDDIELLLGGDLVVTGAIDDVRVRGTPTGTTLTVTGRSRTAQLIDNSARKPWVGHRDLTVAEFAARLADPYGVDVVVDLGSRRLKPIEECAVTAAESVWSAVDRYARAAGVLVADTPAGALLVTESGRGSAQVLRGGTGYTVALSGRKLYREYEVIGQTAGGPTGAPRAGVTASARDDRVPAHRYLALRAEAQTDSDRAQDRALFEATTRAGQALTISYTVPGWRGDTGALWAPGDTVALDDPVARVRGRLVVSEVTWRAGAGGSETDLTLVPRAALPLRGLAGGTPADDVDVTALWGGR